jgi:hypothetical protein
VPFHMSRVSSASFCHPQARHPFALQAAPQRSLPATALPPMRCPIARKRKATGAKHSSPPSAAAAGKCDDERVAEPNLQVLDATKDVHAQIAELRSVLSQAEVETPEAREARLRAEAFVVALEARGAEARKDRLQAQAELDELLARIAAENIPVRQCILNSRMFAQPLHPAGGGPLEAGESPSSTSTKRAWWNLTKHDVERWSDCGFVKFLEKADDIMVEHHGIETPLLPLILDGKTEPSTARILKGLYLTPANIADVQYKSERALDLLLLCSVWTALERVMGRAGQDELRYPASKHLKTLVTTDACRRPVVTVPNQYAQFSKCAKKIESWMRQPADAVFPDQPSFASVSAEGSAGLDQAGLYSLLAKTCARVIVELAPDALCPMRKGGRSSGDAAEAIGGDLVDCIESEYRDDRHDPVSQVVTYAALTRTKPVAICTGNTMTYGWVEVREQSGEGGSEPFVKLTKKFQWATSDVPLACRPEWSHWDVLIRFILASMETWYSGAFPEAFKKTFKAPAAWFPGSQPIRAYPSTAGARHGAASLPHTFPTPF